MNKSFDQSEKNKRTLFLHFKSYNKMMIRSQFFFSVIIYFPLIRICVQNNKLWSYLHNKFFLAKLISLKIHKCFMVYC